MKFSTVIANKIILTLLLIVSWGASWLRGAENLPDLTVGFCELSVKLETKHSGIELAKDSLDALSSVL